MHNERYVQNHKEIPDAQETKAGVNGSAHLFQAVNQFVGHTVVPHMQEVEDFNIPFSETEENSENRQKKIRKNMRNLKTTLNKYT